jgi:cell division septation protein DedD
MATFGFGKKPPEDDGIPPEPVEGETEALPPEEIGDKPNRLRRPLILAGIGIVAAGGLYLASSLFFSAPPPPVPPPPRPPAPAAVPAAPTKEAAPAPATSDAKAAPVKGLTPAPSTAPPPSAPAKAAAPGKAAAPAPPAKTDAAKAPEPAPPTKPAAPAPRMEAKAAPKPANATGKGYSVQVGAMAVEENALKLKKKLDELGFEAAVRKGAGFASRHVVTVGDPTTRREAEETARRLNVDGYPSQLAPHEGKFTPQVGSFVSLDEAIDLSRDLQKKNYRPKITSSTSTGTLFQVRHGQFDTRAAAAKRGEELKAKGFNVWVVPN